MVRRVQRQTLVEQVRDILREEIFRLRPGDRLAAEEALARRHDVSTLTVREALSALVDQGLIERRQGSGTYVRDPAAGRHVAILIDMDISDCHASYYYLRLVQMLRLCCQEHGLANRLYVGHASVVEPEPGRITCAEFIHDLEANRFSAVVAIATQPYPSLVGPLAQRGVPAIGGEKGYPYRVGVDMSAVVRRGVAELAGQGCRRLAFIGSSTQAGAFRQALGEQGLPVVPAWIRAPKHPAISGEGRAAFQAIWQAAERPDGLLVADDVLFQDVTMAVLQAHVDVPGELRLATHANRGSNMPILFPVALLEVDPDEVASATGALLHRLLAGESGLPTCVDLDFRVVASSADRVTAQP